MLKVSRIKPLDEEDLLCDYGCGQTAHYKVGADDKPCCSQRAYDCKNYSKWFGSKIKRRYKEHPERIKMQRRIGKEVHNRKSVIEKKRKAMLNLHKSDPKFAKNYEKGRESFRILVKDLCENHKHWKGPGNSNETHHLIANKLFAKNYCEICGLGKMLNYQINANGLHQHCVSGDHSDLTENNWVTCCAMCHKRTFHPTKSIETRKKMSISAKKRYAAQKKGGK